MGFVDTAGKFYVTNLRMVLLRNALIVLAVVAALVVVVTVCVREAYRPTMTIAAFDVPPALEAGDLKGAWADNRVDVAIPQAGFTLQSLFRYLRYASGNELSIDGEIVLDGDDATLKVRVAGKPPTVAKGPLADWERLVGDLAGGVLEVTQPAVHAAWLGQKAATPAELAALSRYLRRMLQANPPHSAAVLSVAYDAYGSALERQGRSDDALRAFDEAMKRDPTNGVSVVNTARARSVRRDYAGAAPLYLRAQSLQLPEAMKIAALRSRVFGATNTGDCDAAAQAFADAKRSRLEWRTPSSTDTSGGCCSRPVASRKPTTSRAARNAC